MAAPAPSVAASLFNSEPEVPEVVEEVDTADDSLDLTSEYGVSADDEVSERSADEADFSTVTDPAVAESDLLELGDAEIVEEPAPEPANWQPPVDVTPAPAQAAPRISTGGTLFERMSNLSRGLSRSDDDDDVKDKDDAGTGGLNIPRFLDRQSNN